VRFRADRAGWRFDRVRRAAAWIRQVTPSAKSVSPGGPPARSTDLVLGLTVW
jgi:hypothetical protein